MGVSFVWKALVLYLVSLALLRFSGRKSLSQMTIGTTVVMISIGSVIVNPLVDKGVLKTVCVIAIFIAVLVILEYLQMKFSWLQSLLVGRPMVVVQDGIINRQAMKKLRLTDEKLNMRLRQHGISSVQEVQMVTVEANGEIGYELKPGSRPLTVIEFERLIRLQASAGSTIGEQSAQSTNLFTQASEQDASGDAL